MQTERQIAANPKTKIADLACESAGRLLYHPQALSSFISITQRKADTRFTVPLRVEG